VAFKRSLDLFLCEGYWVFGPGLVLIEQRDFSCCLDFFVHIMRTGLFACRPFFGLGQVFGTCDLLVSWFMAP